MLFDHVHLVRGPRVAVRRNHAPQPGCRPSKLSPSVDDSLPHSLEKLAEALRDIARRRRRRADGSHQLLVRRLHAWQHRMAAAGAEGHTKGIAASELCGLRSAVPGQPQVACLARLPLPPIQAMYTIHKPPIRSE